MSLKTMTRFASTALLIATVAAAVTFVVNPYEEKEQAGTILISIVSGFFGAMQSQQREED